MISGIRYIKNDAELEIKNLLNREDVFIITDENVFSHYKNLISPHKHIILPAGEASKSLTTVEMLILKLSEMKCSKDSMLIGFGGGVVTDITGFVAATYKRGIKHGFIATTIIAQADAALGGKNAVNISRRKNLMGTFKKPEFILCPTEMLKTLPEIEAKSGMAEVIKTAIIESDQLIQLLQSPPIDWINNSDFLYPIMKKSGEIKMKFVEIDFYDKKERNILNLGHTLGHAIESTYDVKHGLAVAIGMVHVLKLSAKAGLIQEKTVDLAISTLTKYNIPFAFDYKVEDIISKIPTERRTSAGGIKFVTFKEPGQSLTMLGQ